MVGGKVIEIIQLPDRVWVDTQEQVWNPATQSFRDGGTCAIYVQRTTNAERIAVGDSLWWQGAEAYWTPTDGSSFPETPIPRRGYSGVPRP